jgi:hypothetical protein
MQAIGARSPSTSEPGQGSAGLRVLMPVFNDWPAAFAFITLGARNATAFLPARDFSAFVLSFDPMPRSHRS